MSLAQRLRERNVGTLDRVIRILPAIAVAYSWMTGSLTGVGLVVLGAISAVLFVTAVTRKCSIYAMLGIRTCPVS